MSRRLTPAVGVPPHRRGGTFDKLGIGRARADLERLARVELQPPPRLARARGSRPELTQPNPSHRLEITNVLHHERRSHAPHLRLLPPLPPFGLPEAARARHARRALEGAVEHGVALLAALGLPRIVTSDFEPIDPAMVGDAVDRAIAALDEADAPGEDLEDEGHDEPTLGWCERVELDRLADGSGEDEASLGWSANVSQLALGPNTEDGEHTLGAPERHPHVASMTGPWFEPAAGGCTRRDTAGHSQVSWAQGARQDGEGEAEPGYDLPEGDDERCASGDVDGEPSLGWPEDPEARLDPTRQPDADGDREADPLDAVDISSTCEQRDARAAARRIGDDMARRARMIRRGGRPTDLPRAGNLVPVDLRVIGVRGLPWMGGARG